MLVVDVCMLSCFSGVQFFAALCTVIPPGKHVVDGKSLKMAMAEHHEHLNLIQPQPPSSSSLSETYGQRTSDTTL